MDMIKAALHHGGPAFGAIDKKSPFFKPDFKKPVASPSTSKK
jgi:hypothetical protein